MRLPDLTTDVEIARLFRAALDERAYDEPHVAALLGADSATLDRERAAPYLRRRIAGKGGLGTLIELFGLGVDVDEVAAIEALAPLPIAAGEHGGILQARDGRVYPLIGVDLHQGLRLARDASGPSKPRAADHVVGVHSASLSLAGYTPRRWVDRTLDVGTGSGIHALRAAAHSGTVVATDVNERALQFTAFNAALNGLSNVDVVHGSLFEPVGGQRFDLVVSNPPFVVSPESAFVYRDSGLPGDEISRRVASALPDHLNEGGIGVFIASWVHAENEDWRARARDWLAGRGCDVWLLRHQTHDPLTYAATWALPRDEAEYEERLQRWLEYYDALGIETMTTATVLVRRRSDDDNWFRAEVASPVVREPTAEHLERILAGQDIVYTTTDDALLRATVIANEAVRIEQRLARASGNLTVEESVLTTPTGLIYRVPIDGFGVDLLTRCDGTRPLAAAIGEAGATFGLDAASSRAMGLTHSRGWLTTGLATVQQ